jgi:hypothetical protein
MIAPRIDIAADSIHGCTPWVVRVLWLFAFCRCVTVDRRLQNVIVSTRRFWWWTRMRVVRFEQIERVAYRAQAVPVLAPWRYLSLKETGHFDSALFFISLVLVDDGAELPLFTVWERQPREHDWLDRLAGVPQAAPRIGDESAGRIVALIREYLGLSAGRR